jgi:predicted peptidase
LIGISGGAMITIVYIIFGITMATPTAAELPESTGIHDLTYSADNGHAVRYSLRLPASLPRDQSQALILVLHYGGEPSGFYGRPLIEQLIEPAIGGLDAIMVAPVAIGGNWKREENESAVMDLVDALERGYATNPRRRVITGYSMGGVGTWHFIERRPGYFSAAIPVSGFTAAAPGCATPIYALHSSIDSIFNAAQLQELIDAQRAAGCDARVDYVEGIDHFNIPAFVPYLTRVVPWIRETWQRQEGD